MGNQIETSLPLAIIIKDYVSQMILWVTRTFTNSSKNFKHKNLIQAVNNHCCYFYKKNEEMSRGLNKIKVLVNLRIYLKTIVLKRFMCNNFNSKFRFFLIFSKFFILYSGSFKFHSIT